MLTDTGAPMTGVVQLGYEAVLRADGTVWANHRDRYFSMMTTQDGLPLANIKTLHCFEDRGGTAVSNTVVASGFL